MRYLFIDFMELPITPSTFIVGVSVVVMLYLLITMLIAMIKFNITERRLKRFEKYNLSSDDMNYAKKLFENEMFKN